MRLLHTLILTTLVMTVAVAMPAHAAKTHIRVDSSATLQPALRQSLLRLDHQGHGPLDAPALAEFKELIAKYGWPTVTAAGRDGVDAAGDLTLRSSADYDYQDALEAAMQARFDQDINLQAFAVLNDRIEQIHSNTQQFGSLLAMHHGRVVTMPHVSAVEANPLRDQFGLLPLRLRLQQVQAKVDNGSTLAAAMNVPRLSTALRTFTQPALRHELRSMATTDQAVRRAWISSGLKLGSPQQKALQATDSANLIRLRAIFANYGFPDRAMVGREGVQNAWLLVQHATADKRLMTKAVKLARPLMLKGDLARGNYALLVDRVRLQKGEKQVYGSQFTVKSGRLLLRPLEDPSHVDQRRARMGLVPEAEYLKTAEKLYHPAKTSSVNSKKS